MPKPRRVRRLPIRPLRKTPSFDDLADEEPEASSAPTSSESSDASPPPDFAADADEEEGYVPSLEGTPPPKPQPKRPFRLAKPQCFLDAVRPYVEPMSKDAIKLSQLTLAQINAGEAYRGPLVVTDADRAEEEAARAKAAELARYDSDEVVNDREEVIPQVQTRPFSLKRRTRSEDSTLSSSDNSKSELLSSESGHNHRRTLDAFDSPLGSAPTKKPHVSRYNGDKRHTIHTAPSDSEKIRSPPKKVLRLVRRDKMAAGKRANGSNSNSWDNEHEDFANCVMDECCHSSYQASARNVNESETHDHSELECWRQNTQRSTNSGSVALSGVNDDVDPDKVQRPQRRTVRSRTGVTDSMNYADTAIAVPARTAPQILEVIDLCSDGHEDMSQVNVPRQWVAEVIDLCSDDDN